MIKAVASIKSFQESALSLDSSFLKCDICSSEDIQEVREGYVCLNCAVVLEVQKLQYDRPYNEDIIQYAKGVGRTEIGTRRERVISPISIKLRRISKYNKLIDNELAVKDTARAEIARIFGCLDLADYNDVKTMVLKRSLSIRRNFQSGTKYRSIEKLVTIVTYLCLKLRSIPVNPYKLLESSKISKKEFNDFILQVRRYLPEYEERNRQKYIIHRISEVFEHFGLGMPYFYLAKKILFRLWHGIKNTTDDAVCGLVSSIALICSDEKGVTVNSICNYLGIRMSTVQSQVKKKLFDRFKIEGFVSLIRSSDLLKILIRKLGLIECEAPEIVITSDRIKIVVGAITKIFNGHHNINYYFFALRGNDHTPTVITLKINEFIFKINNSKNMKGNRLPNLLEFEIYKYFPHKGPPLKVK